MNDTTEDEANPETQSKPGSKRGGNGLSALLAFLLIPTIGVISFLAMSFLIEMS